VDKLKEAEAILCEIHGQIPEWLFDRYPIAGTPNVSLKYDTIHRIHDWHERIYKSQP